MSLRKKGYGVGARVKLVKKIKGIAGTVSDEFQPDIGQTGTVVGIWSKDSVIVKWDKPLKSSVPEEQVVNVDSLMLLQKSRRKEVIASAPLSKVKDYENHQITGKKVTIWKDEPYYDEHGFVVGYVTIEMKGYIQGKTVYFTSFRVLVSGLPKKYRSIARSYFESISYVDIFPEIFD